MCHRTLSAVGSVICVLADSGGGQEVEGRGDGKRQSDLHFPSESGDGKFFSAVGWVYTPAFSTIMERLCEDFLQIP